MKWLLSVIILTVALSACSSNMGGEAARADFAARDVGSIGIQKPMPDLVVEQVLFWPVNSTTNDTVQFNITVLNDGKAKAAQSKARFFFRDPNNLAMGVYEQVPNLLPGQRYSFVETVAPQVPGTWYVQVKADYFTEVAESDENNNIFDFNWDVYGEVTSLATCWDSDGGAVYNVSGFINGTLVNGSSFYQEDYCISNVRLIERVCGASDWPMIMGHNCSINCTAGACI